MEVGSDTAPLAGRVTENEELWFHILGLVVLKGLFRLVRAGGLSW